MTFKEFALESCGYEVISTFWEDFSIAERFGINAIKDTYKRALEDWKDSYKYLTELVFILNHKCWHLYEKGDMNTSKVYSDLYYTANNYAYEHLKGSELNYYLSTLD